MYKPVVLIVLDGWGINPNPQSIPNQADTPTFDTIRDNYPMVALQASGISVGIPWGEAGNSEVGHISLGAGKIIYQNLPRITLAIQDETFFNNKNFIDAIENAKKNNGKLHLMGLVGTGSVHAYNNHLYALLELAKRQKINKVYIHAFTDGRDSHPRSGKDVIAEIEKNAKEIGVGKIASLCGRNWAMDRNNNWDRIEKAYNLLVKGDGIKTEDPTKALEESYARNIFDEFIEPTVITENGIPRAVVADGDAVIFFNFREDRARELTKAIVLPGFNKFPREKQLKISMVTMTEYEDDLPTAVAFPPEILVNGLGEVLSNHGLKQLRIAETEKYAHVTYFFNGGKEEPWPGEDHELVPSQIVATFDERPEMSADGITDKLIELLHTDRYDFILVNYANADMVGHTGKEDACKKAVEFLDKNLERLIPEILKQNGCIFITADHGNIEETRNFRTGETNTEHSSNPVPLWYITPDNHRKREMDEILRSENEVKGLLSDVAPTILAIMNIPKPPEMHGDSLLPILN